jgi:hypothetical protein
VRCIDFVLFFLLFLGLLAIPTSAFRSLRGAEALSLGVPVSLTFRGLALPPARSVPPMVLTVEAKDGISGLFRCT